MHLGEYFAELHFDWSGPWRDARGRAAEPLRIDLDDAYKRTGGYPLGRGSAGFAGPLAWSHRCGTAQRASSRLTPSTPTDAPAWLPRLLVNLLVNLDGRRLEGCALRYLLRPTAQLDANIGVPARTAWGAACYSSTPAEPAGRLYQA